MHGFHTQHQFGSLIFCQACGNLLDPIGNESMMNCNQCGLTQSAQDVDSFQIITRSPANAFNSSLKRMLVQRQAPKREKAATIREKCPKCGAPEMSFHTMQLRSADEGQTIFYHCTQCGYKFSVNS
jgi:DNA-directed RNA polymerase I subunit RPA12